MYDCMLCWLCTATCVATCALLVVACGQCWPLSSLSEHHCAENDMSESVCFIFVLCLFYVCFVLVSLPSSCFPPKKIFFTPSLLPQPKIIADERRPADKPPVSNPVRNSTSLLIRSGLPLTCRNADAPRTGAAGGAAILRRRGESYQQESTAESL